MQHVDSSPLGPLPGIESREEKMEIWIIGIPLVILMVFLSTRIKRLANQAYGEELIERDGFALLKPEGFIALESVEEGFQFQAESKGFGAREATEPYREASASLAIRQGNIEAALSEQSMVEGIEVISRTEGDCSRRFKEISGDAVVHVFQRFVSLDDSCFLELTVRVLEESIDEFEESAKLMIRSLRRN